MAESPAEDPASQQRLERRTRICVWIILVGLANFLIFTVLYALIWGEAVNGQVRVIGGETRYFLQSGKQVPRWVFIYSGIHSISIWPTVAAVMLAMLTIAKDRIIASASSTVRRGRAMITMLAVVIAILMGILTVLFARNFVHRMHHPVEVPRVESMSAPAGGGRSAAPAVRGDPDRRAGSPLSLNGRDESTFGACERPGRTDPQWP